MVYYVTQAQYYCEYFASLPDIYTQAQGQVWTYLF